MSQPATNFETSEGMRNVVSGLMLIGALTLIGGLIQAPTRIWANLLLVSFYMLCLGLGSLLFIALQFATNAGWSVSLRRVPEAMAQLLPPIGAFVLFVLLVQPMFLAHTVSHSQAGAMWFKYFWLSRPFLLARAVTFLALWSIFARIIVGHSRAQETDGLALHTFRSKSWSSVFIIVFALSFSLASFDWIMSIESEWFSTMFGVYNFAGLILSSLAAITIFSILLRRHGVLREAVTNEHLHALGKLLFGFSSFWMYIWFCQYMLIWYVNNPEETFYYITRMKGGWLGMFLLDVALNWIIPFLVLLPRSSKRSEQILLTVSAVILVGRWVDLYVLIFPSFAGAGFPLEIWDFGMAFGGMGMFLYMYFGILSKTPLLPLKDPLYQESIQHHQ